MFEPAHRPAHTSAGNFHWSHGQVRSAPARCPSMGRSWGAVMRGQRFLLALRRAPGRNELLNHGAIPARRLKSMVVTTQ